MADREAVSDKFMTRQGRHARWCTCGCSLIAEACCRGIFGRRGLCAMSLHIACTFSPIGSALPVLSPGSQGGYKHPHYRAPDKKPQLVFCPAGGLGATPNPGSKSRCPFAKGGIWWVYYPASFPGNTRQMSTSNP